MAPVNPPMRPPLRRPRTCVVSGVAAGLARHLGVSPTLVRVGFVVAGLCWGAGLLLYLWLWLLTPWDELGAGAATADADLSGVDPTADGANGITRRAAVSWILVGAAVVVWVWTAVLLLFAMGGAFGGATLLPSFLLMVVLAVVAAAWAGLVDRRDPRRGRRTERAVRITATVLLVTILVPVALAPGLLAAAQIGFALLSALGVALVFAPTLLTQWRELGAERTKRIREEQRAEMAAHLHDSVLQTLALIQHRAGATSEVARIARAQERELRDWLYAGDAPADRDLGGELRSWGADLEIDYPVTFDVVEVGESAERASGELAAAAREAMLNAARHAGGEVSVYIEGTPSGVEVFVRDRGPGFDAAAVPSDRLGVRESIVGRMRRAGGRAVVRPGAGGQGTEVQLGFDAREEAARA